MLGTRWGGVCGEAPRLFSEWPQWQFTRHNVSLL